MDKRGAYFFVIDAMIAAVVLSGSMIVLFASYKSPPESSVIIQNSENFLSFLQDTRVRDIESTVIKNLWISSNNISNPDNSLIGQTLEFYFNNKSDPKIKLFLGNITAQFVPADRSVIITIYDPSPKVLYNKTTRPQESSDIMVVSRKIAYQQINESYIFGPVSIEVMIWA